MPVSNPGAAGSDRPFGDGGGRRHAPAAGTFCRVGLATSDPPGATAFYGALFEWEAEEIPAGPLGSCTLLRSAGREVAILYRQTLEARAARVRPHWTSFVWVEDADEAGERARALGGREVREPLEAGDAGRVATVGDPTGAIISLWQARTSAGPAAVGAGGELRAPWWNDLVTRDLAAAESFYGALFGWTFTTGPGGTTTVTRAGRPIASMRARDEAASDAPDRWLPYFRVEAIAAVVTRARGLGGRPAAAAYPRRAALLSDPQGALFGVLEGGSRIAA